MNEMEILVEANQDAYYSPEEAHIAANEGHGKIYRVFGVLNIEHILLLYEAHTEIRLVVLLWRTIVIFDMRHDLLQK